MPGSMLILTWVGIVRIDSDEKLVSSDLRNN
jgi:hypothetical protein